MPDDSKKQFTLNMREFEKLMQTLEISFVATVDGKKNKDGTSMGKIVQHDSEVAQLIAYPTAFNREKVRKIVLETDFPPILNALKSIKIRANKTTGTNLPKRLKTR